jgi:hypothetical protein
MLSNSAANISSISLDALDLSSHVNAEENTPRQWISIISHPIFENARSMIDSAYQKRC